MGNWFSLGELKMEGVDVESFEVSNMIIAKDKNKAYYEERTIDYNIDLPSFRVKEGDLMFTHPVDVNNVYSLGYEGKVKVVTGADPETFTMVDHDWGKDGKHHFFNNQLVEAEYVSFEVINEHFCRDHEKLFSYSTDAGVHEFMQASSDVQKLDKDHIYDDQNIYWYAWYIRRELADSVFTIPYVNISTVIISENDYLMVDGLVYGQGVLLKEADGSSFEELDFFYARDSSNAYWWGLLIDGADGPTFEVFSGSYARDKNRVYYEGAVVEKANPATFHAVKDWYYYADDKYKFNEGKILKEEDI